MGEGKGERRGREGGLCICMCTSKGYTIHGILYTDLSTWNTLLVDSQPFWSPNEEAAVFVCPDSVFF